MHPLNWGRKSIPAKASFHEVTDGNMNLVIMRGILGLWNPLASLAIGAERVKGTIKLYNDQEDPRYSYLTGTDDFSNFGL